jgi:crotonobetainyl-CoA:carnitine CoA-transferase CaiB-like acyl-CoA transferase
MYDLTAQGMSGLMSVAVFDAQLPVKFGGAAVDYLL